MNHGVKGRRENARKRACKWQHLAAERQQRKKEKRRKMKELKIDLFEVEQDAGYKPGPDGRIALPALRMENRPLPSDRLGDNVFEAAVTMTELAEMAGYPLTEGKPNLSADEETLTRFEGCVRHWLADTVGNEPEGTRFSVTLTGAAPAWLYLGLQHALHGSVERLIYEAPNARLVMWDTIGMPRTGTPNVADHLAGAVRKKLREAGDNISVTLMSSGPVPVWAAMVAAGEIHSVAKLLRWEAPNAQLTIFRHGS